MAGLAMAEATAANAATGGRASRITNTRAAPDRAWLESLLQNFDDLSNCGETVHCSESLLRATREHLSRHPTA